MQYVKIVAEWSVYALGAFLLIGGILKVNLGPLLVGAGLVLLSAFIASRRN